MHNAITTVDKCRVCGDDDWLEVISFGAVPLANGYLEPGRTSPVEPTYPLEVVACRGCWLLSLRHVIDPEVLFGDYVYVSSESSLIQRHMRRIVDWCAEKAPLEAGDLVVEFGSNVGTQLRFFQERGFRTAGIDPARNLARQANDQGIDTIDDFFGPHLGDRILDQYGRAAVVLGRQCFAHIDDVHGVIDGVDAVLADDGLLVIEVPYLVELLDQNQFDTIYHEHLSYFSLKTLSRLFSAHGFTVVDVERAAVHGGSIIVFAARQGGSPRPAPAVAEMLADEQRRGLSTERPYREFAERVDQVTDGVRTLVHQLVADGRKVAGYGAPSKGSALLQACGLGPEHVAFCSDTTVEKQGKLLPGTHIPICSPAQAQADPPDVYLLLAWNYAEEILAKERSFLESGGQFIVPIPRPRMVSLADLPPVETA